LTFIAEWFLKKKLINFSDENGKLAIKLQVEKTNCERLKLEVSEYEKEVKRLQQAVKVLSDKLVINGITE